MHYAKNDGWLLLLWLLLCLNVTSCSTTQKQPPPEAVAESVIPKLSSELKKAPEPSGAYWARVIEWRKVWREMLKTLQPKYED